MAIIRWVHLSDLHFGYDDFTVREFRRKLPEELRKYMGINAVPFEYIFLTGDLRYARSKNDPYTDYDAATAHINELCGPGCLNISPSHIMVVPGNHDVEIASSSLRMEAVQRVKGYYSPRVGRIEADDLAYLKPTEPFQAAFQNITGRAFDENHSMYEDDQLRIMCLDTSILCTKSIDDYSQLYIGLERIQHLTSNSTAGKPLLVLAHHSTDWFETREEKKLVDHLLDINAAVYLCGHIHKDKVSTYRDYTRPGSHLPQFYAPTTMDQDEAGQQTTVMGFLVGELDTQTRQGNVTFFKWDIDNTSFRPGDSLPLDDKEVISPVLHPSYHPNYLDMLRKQFEKARKQSGSYILNEIRHELFPDLRDELGISYSSDGKESSPLPAHLQCLWSRGEERHLLLTGEGGIGKTVSLLETCKCLLAKNIPALYLPLHDLLGKSMEEYIKSRVLQCDSALAKQFFDNLNQEFAGHPSVVLLLDGFNEVTEDSKTDMLADIRDWRDRYPGLQIVLTCRYDMGTYYPTLSNMDHLMVQPLRKEQIIQYLGKTHISVPNDAVLQLLEYPLMLMLYVSAERYSQINSKQIALRWKQNTDSSGAIIWNFLQLQLQKAVFDNHKEKFLPDYAFLVEYLLPYLGYKMEESSQFSIEQDALYGWLKEGMEYYRDLWEQKGSTSRHIGTIIRDYNADLSWDKNRIYRMLTQDLHLVVISTGETASFIHQNFRDCLAAVYLANEVESLPYTPSPWKKCFNTYVSIYLSELIDLNTLSKMWESKRGQQIPLDSYELYNIFVLYCHIFQNDLSGMDFCKLDLRTIPLRNVIFASKANKVSFRDAIIGNYTFIPNGHTAGISTVAIHPDGKRCISGSEDNTMKIWDMENGNCLCTFRGHDGGVTRIAIHPDGKHCITGSGNGVLKVWDIESGTCLYALKGHNRDITVILIHPDGKRYLSGSWDSNIKIWDIMSGKFIRPLKGHGDLISSLAITADGATCISGSWDKTIKIWDLESGNCKRTINDNIVPIEDICILPDGKHLIGKMFHDTLKVWDLESGKTQKTLYSDSTTHANVQLFPDGKHYISSSKDGIIQIWDIESGNCIRTMEGHESLPDTIALHPDGKRIIYNSHNAVKVWDMERGCCLRTLKGFTVEINKLAILPDGKRCICLSQDNTIRVWDIENRRCLSIYDGHNESICSLTIHPDGKRFVINTLETCKIFDIESGYCLGRHNVDAINISFLPDGKRFICGSGVGGIKLYDFESGNCILTWVGHKDDVSSLVPLSDGKRCISGSWDNSIKVWDIDSGTCLRTLEGHTNGVYTVAVHPDGKRCISGSWDNTLKVWDIDSCYCLLTFEGHTDSICGLAIHPDGKRCISGSYDKTIKVWDIENGMCLHTLEGHTGYISDLALLSDGRHCVSCSEDGTIRIWDIECGIFIDTIHPISGINIIGFDFTGATFDPPTLKKLIRMNGGIVD